MTRPPPPITRAQALAADRVAHRRMGLPLALLMENAGRGLASVTTEECVAYELRRVLVLAHRGHNGGDGLTAARHLVLRGFDVRVLLTCTRARGCADATWAASLRAAERVGAVVIPGSTTRRAVRAIRAHVRGALLVDALLGTGLRGPVAGHLAAVLEELRSAGRPTVAADIPSGVDADTGDCLGPAPACVATATFLAPKRGLLRGDGARLSGRVVVCDIGVPWWNVLPRPR